MPLGNRRGTSGRCRSARGLGPTWHLGIQKTLSSDAGKNLAKTKTQKLLGDIYIKQLIFVYMTTITAMNPRRASWRNELQSMCGYRPTSRRWKTRSVSCGRLLSAAAGKLSKNTAMRALAGPRDAKIARA